MMKNLYKLIQEKAETQPPLFIFDYDGTLKDLVPGGNLEEKLDANKAEELKKFAKSNAVSIVTGRNTEQIYELLNNNDHIQHYFGNHGVIHFDSSTKTTTNLLKELEEIKLAIKKFHQAVHPQVQKYQFYMEERKFSYSFHVDPTNKEGNKIAEKIMRLECAKFPNFEILMGRTHIEFRPKELHKGQAIKFLTTIYSNRHFIYFGDDQTDVDAFKEIKKVSGTCVSIGGYIKDHSDFDLGSTQDTWDLIQKLI